jgi:hypothetical protein
MTSLTIPALQEDNQIAYTGKFLVSRVIHFRRASLLTLTSPTSEREML